MSCHLAAKNMDSLRNLRYSELIAHIQTLLRRPILRARRPSILFVDLGATFGGAEVYLLSLLPSLKEQVDCLVLCSNNEFQQRLRDADIAYVPTFTATGLLKIAQLAWAAWLILMLLLRRRIDTLQINGYSEILLVPIARLLGRNAIPTRHLSFEIEAKHWYQAPGRYIARALYRSLARTATQIVCVSEQVGREVEPLAPGRVRVIPNWVHEVPAFRERDINAGRPLVVLFVGRMVEYKGLHVLIEAIRLMQSGEHALPIKTVAVGDGPFRPELERLASGYNIEFAGFQREVARYYASADVFVTSSLGPEGSSLVTMEAMAHGVPCILSNLPVHREIAREGEIAALFRSGDAVDLALTLHRVLSSREVRDLYAHRAYEVIHKHHTCETAVRAYLDAFSVEAA
jgi:glycosyltransferase involved in cell wall biosynthesis